MSNATRLMHNVTSYFESLSETTQEIVKQAILDAAKDRGGPDCWKGDDECIESIECHSRDGFIANSDNKGGLTYRNFTDLLGYWGGGYISAHEGAAKEIERQIDYSFECLTDSVFGEFEELLTSKGISKEDCNYHWMKEAAETHDDLKPVLRAIENGECEALGGDSSIMHEFRFMYHGKENGVHTASVSAALNTEGPYHRSSISWARNVFCEGASEVEIKWRNNAELKRKLAKVLAKVSKEIF